ncbi:MAG: F0F1 ATP synthase subunit epsilon [Clostridia bacterium]|nr:F0F1 ATP synthase subunit epsilon [Clostridia bacterium]
MNTYLLTVSTPDGNAFEGEAVSLSVRGVEGELAVMAGHIPFVTTVCPCDCRIELPDGTEKTGHTDGGILTVSGTSATLLAGRFTW